jgi:hypothetical protein
MEPYTKIERDEYLSFYARLYVSDVDIDNVWFCLFYYCCVAVLSDETVLYIQSVNIRFRLLCRYDHTNHRLCTHA